MSRRSGSRVNRVIGAFCACCCCRDQEEEPIPLDVRKNTFDDLEGDETALGIGLAENIQQPQVGFKAKAPAGLCLEVTTGKRLTCFTDVLFNLGGHYNVNDHVFTVPITGSYEVTLETSQRENSKGWIRTEVKKERRNPTSGRWETDGLVFCMTEVWGDRTDKPRDTRVSVEPLRRGDRLWVEVADVRSKPKLESPCVFACVLKT